MPTLTPRLQMAGQPHTEDDPYQDLVAAIIARAVCDVHGLCLAPGARPVAVVQQEALAWLQAETPVRDLLELCGVDAEPVLRRIHQQLAEGDVSQVLIPDQSGCPNS